MKKRLGLINALKPFAATQLAQKVNVCRSYLYNYDAGNFNLPDDVRDKLKAQLIHEANELIKFAKTL